MFLRMNNKVNSFNYLEYLIKRIFEYNKFENTEKLLIAVDKAVHIDDFREQKSCLNKIHELAPFSNRHGYLLKYSELHEFLHEEITAFANEHGYHIEFNRFIECDCGEWEVFPATMSRKKSQTFEFLHPVYSEGMYQCLCGNEVISRSGYTEIEN